MSHELRTPLNSLLIFTNNLLKDKDKNLHEQQLNSLNIIHHNGKDLLKLVNEILDLAKIESGKETVIIEKIYISDITFYVDDLFRISAESKNLTLLIITDPGLPEYFFSDRGKVVKILNNLMSNAIKFTSKGKIIVEFKYQTSDEKVNYIRPIVISITDSGIGIPEHLHQSIYNEQRYAHPFTLFMFDIDSFKSINDSFGHIKGDEVLVKIADILSNSLRKSDIIGRFGGDEFLVLLGDTAIDIAIGVVEKIRDKIRRIQLIDTPELTITISGGICQHQRNNTQKTLISTVDALLYKAKLNGKNRIESEENNDLRKIKKQILIVDDNDEFRKMLKDILEILKFSVILAENGKKGLDILKNNSVDLIICDVLMPEMDGFEFIDIIRKKDKKVKVIITTGGGRIDASTYLTAADELGADGIIQKPFSIEEIEDLINELLN